MDHIGEELKCDTLVGFCGEPYFSADGSKDSE